MLFLGDILLNVERIRLQAAEYGHSEKREAAFLIAHSVLHLIGYDHVTKEQEELMNKKQEAALSALRIYRDVR